MSFRIRSHKRAFLDQWNARMCRTNVTPLYDNVVVAVLRQQGFADLPYVPRNLYDPQSLYDALALYSPELAPRVDMKDPFVKAGISMAWKAFAKPVNVPKLSAFHLGTDSVRLYNLLSIKGDKSAGLTAYGQSKAEAWPTGILKARDQLLNNRSPEPCLAGVRTQEGKLGRLIWGYPMSMTILEALVARPILERLKVDPGPMAFAQTSTDIGIKMRKAAAHNSHYLSFDVKKFDASISKGLIQCAFNALRTWFDHEQEVYDGVTVGELFKQIEDYFIHTPIVMPSNDGPLLYRGKRHGVPSGSYFTQVVDSFVNVVMLGAADARFKFKVRLDEVFVLGDDLLFFSNKDLCLSKLSEFFSEHFNATLSIDKSETGLSSEPIPFLGRKWKNGIPHRRWDEAMKRGIAPERYRNYGEHKVRGARAVLASYGLTAMLEGLPPGYNPSVGLSATQIQEDWASGLVQFLMRSGDVSKSFKQALY